MSMIDVALTRKSEGIYQIRAESPRAVRVFRRMGYPPVVSVCLGYAIETFRYFRQNGLRCVDVGV